MEAIKFTRKWKSLPGREIENSQSFLNALCDLLGVAKPHDSATDRLAYGFERPVTFHHANGSTSSGRIDLYKRGSFVLEAKQGSEQKARPSDPRQQELITGEKFAPGPKGMAYRNSPAWTANMLKAHGQAYAYARALEPSEGWPPFLIVVDIGHVFHVYADFTGAGKNYAPFPDGTKYRIHIDDLANADIRKRLKAIWEDPMSLDPTRTTARVTRQIATELAELGKSFEAQGHNPEATARFLMRCLFTMFAEDVELIPTGAFTRLLAELRERPKDVAPTLQALWKEMDKGGHSAVLRRNVLHFNGGLFADANALPVNNLQLGLLIRAAEHDWKSVEPAIFGTLMERALSPKERHKLGAHFTPRAYVERLVGPTILEPLRSDWLDVQAAALKLHQEGKLNEAIDLVREFKRSLCNIRVLDPACGSGNFLYVALEGMKRLEGEVMETLQGFGDREIDAFTVDPHQFLGIELNPWAAAVAELVLWIGYLQWHFRTFGKATPSQPVLKDFHNIENRDALLDLKGARPRVDEKGKPVTRWDGESYITHNVTGERVPDPKARLQIVDFNSAKQAEWPPADFIVGNPPFIGNKRMREKLGDGYVEALRRVYPTVPESAELVMYWWERAALRLRGADASKKPARQFGFITTNSIRQILNRKVVESHLSAKKSPLTLAFAVPDHPWIDSSDGADVRIAMTAASLSKRVGRLVEVADEAKTGSDAGERTLRFSTRRGTIFATLTVGPNLDAAEPLLQNVGLAFMGVIRVGSGFLLTASEAGELESRRNVAEIIRPYMNGKDLVDGRARRLVIDLFGLTEAAVRANHPKIYQRLYDTVRAERLEKRGNGADYEQYFQQWWLFAKPRPELRAAIEHQGRYIATTETAKHRAFSFVDSSIVPDQKLRVIALSKGSHLALLSSRIHVTWADAAGGRQGVGNDPVYNSSRCFEPFPFASLTKTQERRLDELGEELDAHRKARQKEHPKLTLTQMYNVLEMLRAGETIEGKDKIAYEQGLIGTLKGIHDRIDAAVADAYGWPSDLSEEDILERLVALNKERKLEEAAGKVHWLRPDFQNPSGTTVKIKGREAELDLGEDETEAGKTVWPSSLPIQVSFVRGVLLEIGSATADEVGAHFVRAPRKQVQAILESLAALGQARTEDGTRFAA